MMKIIKLTESNHNGPVWINTAHIIKMYRNQSGGTTIFMVNKDSFLRVKETPEQVVEKIMDNHVLM